ncbi:MAG: Two-component sensor PilS [uncultured Thiotrichaceae bacterium]|uniref:histidine kinase n=1 Tax=uncultured Thiotrichaceae bacterium TaxID=298394 RepID=A0A6S6T8N6_9GAMM|nr:MAG: Two-component sensor PilS [uncultured Thiotrichaceae bacterium]
MQSGARTTSATQQQTVKTTVNTLEQAAPFFLHEDPWNLLRLYHVYRLALSGALILAMVSESNLIMLGTHDFLFFKWLTSVYLLIAIVSNLTSYFEWPDLTTQGVGYVLIDILVLFGILYSSGGVSAGVGVLLVIPVLIPYICSPGYVSILLAALTGMGLIGMEVWLGMQQGQPVSSSLSHSGIIALFIMLASWLGDRWIQKASQMAKLANRRGIDLANMSQLNQSILDRLESGILVIENSGSIRHMNAAGWSLLGSPGNWRSKPLKVFAPELDEHYQHWLSSISPRTASFDLRHQQATELRARFTQLGRHSRQTTMINLEDTSEQREKVQGVKLASLGQLTASIAHEIRNPLGAISHAAQLMTESQNLDKADTRLLQIIQSNAKRMNLTIESVLNLSRKKNPNRERLPLKGWLYSFLRDFILQHNLKEKQVSLFIEPADLMIEFDPAHLHQIMWNLCRNAVKYAHDTPQKLQLDIQGGMPSHSRDVFINVIDNGRGMPEASRQRLFEPFFTTSTKGTGLGLFMSRELCLSNGATLEYSPLPTDGSCFRIVFSCAQH